MADHREEVDAWPREHIEPLPPPPGTFDQIKRRARRRKFRKLAITATSAAVLVAAAVAVPQVVNLQVLNPNPTSGVAAAVGQSSAATPSRTSRHSESSAAASSAVPVTSPVPANFQPTSVTFIGTRTGWVIGQAETPGHCTTRYCTSVARTDNVGQSWHGVPAPVTGEAQGATGVSQIRFLNLRDGWAFGPELFVTHDGGRTWAQVDTRGLRVTDLETVGHRAFAVWASCTGNSVAFAKWCTRFTLYPSPASGGDWTPVGTATTGLTDTDTFGAASLALSGSRGYLLAPDGALYAGPVDGSAPWQRVGSLVSSCDVGTAQPWAQPSGAVLGVVNAHELIVACTSAGNPAAGTQQKQIFTSPDGGASWLPLSTAPTAGTALSLAASPSQSVVLATDRGIDLLPAGGVAWRAATLNGAVPGGGFGYVGMTTGEQGIALPADPASGTVWFTFDGGQSWHPSRVGGS